MTSGNLLDHNTCNSQKSDGFKHDPLNLDVRSIRLIRLCPTGASENDIDCEVRHALIEDTYTCVSYVWGAPHPTSYIKINGKLHEVRQNLFEFLKAARLKFTSRWFWIDALSIDQFNVLERNHQVQQMGQIYSGAQQVISWLGNDRQVAAYIWGINDRLTTGHGQSSTVAPSPLGAIRRSEYWDRAWITQEVVLARCIILMACHDAAVVKGHPLTDPRTDEAKTIAKFILGGRGMLDLHRLGGSSLITLLYIFKDKQCQNPRGRVFSLLSLCEEGSDVTVDYDIPLRTLAQRVLRSCELSFCICSVGVVSRSLDLDKQESDYLDSTPDTHFAQLSMTVWASSEMADEQEVWVHQPCKSSSCSQNSKLRSLDTHTIDKRIMSITLNMNRLCSSIPARITIDVNSKMEATGYTYRRLETKRRTVNPALLLDRKSFTFLQSESRTSRSHPRSADATVSRSHPHSADATVAEVCVIHMSFDFMLALASHRRGCCGHVSPEEAIERGYDLSQPLHEDGRLRGNAMVTLSRMTPPESHASVAAKLSDRLWRIIDPRCACELPKMRVNDRHIAPSSGFSTEGDFCDVKHPSSYF